MAEPLRLVHVIYNLGLGGAERQLYELCTRLPKDSFSVSIVKFKPGGEYEQPLKDAGVSVHTVEKRGLLDPGFILRLGKTLREINPDIVHTWMLSANLWTRLALDFSGIKPKVLAAERKTFVNEPWLRRMLVGWIGGRADKVLGNSRAVVENQIVDGVNRDKTVLIENGIEVERFDTAPPREQVLAEEGLDPGMPLVLAIGRFHVQKDHATFVEAAWLLAEKGVEAQYAVLGDGELHEQLEKQIADSGLDGTFHLLKSRPDPEGLMMACSVFCLPSLTEGFPNVLAEAMACGKPCIATNVSGSVDMIENGVRGRLIQVGDSKALAGCIEKYLLDPVLAEAHGSAAKAYIRENNSVDKMVERYIELYKQLAGS